MRPLLLLILLFTLTVAATPGPPDDCAALRWENEGLKTKLAYYESQEKMESEAKEAADAYNEWVNQEPDKLEAWEREKWERIMRERGCP